MSSRLSKLSQRARQLAPEEWAWPDVEAAWGAEILKRLKEYERGEALLFSSADVFAEARRLMQ